VIKMPEKQEEKLTPEEQRKKMHESLEANLENEFYRMLNGSNTLRKDPFYFGQSGHKIAEGLYGSLMTGKEAVDFRNKLYKDALEEREQLGLADMPSYPGNDQVSKYAVMLINEAIMKLPLGNLEKIATEKIAKGAKLDVPEEFKSYTGMEEDLDDETRKMILTYKKLVSEAIKLGNASAVMEGHQYDDINAYAQKLKEAYEKSKEKGE